MMLLRIITYPLLVLAMTWPLFMAPTEQVLGILHIDLIDTLALRTLFSGNESALFYPIGFPFWQLMPNTLDHLLFLPLSLLGFPLADNLWWLFILSLNGYAAHYMGIQIASTEKGAYLCGISFLFSETVLREASLHHTPQALLFSFPLFVASIIAYQRTKKNHQLFIALLSLVLASLSYWYYGLFLVWVAFCCAPMLGRRRLLYLLAGTLVLTLPFLWPYLQLPLRNVGPPQSGSIDASFWFLSTPANRSARVGLVSLLAVLLLLRKHPHRTLILSISIPSVVMLFGSALSVGQTDIPLPASVLNSLPPLSRLHWPERWSVLLHLALSIGLAHANIRWLIPIVLETLFLSHNAPVPTTDIKPLQCLAKLSVIDKPILSVPLNTENVNLPGLHRRIHGNDMLNPFVLPPGVSPLPEWLSWQKTHLPKEAAQLKKDALLKIGLGAIYIDTSPWTHLSTGQVNLLQYQLRTEFGDPIDLGCAKVWWLSPKTPPIESESLSYPQPSNDPLRSIENYWLKE